MTAKRQPATAPASRRERRAVARAERAAQRPNASAARRPSFLNSPIFMFTAAAVVVGLAVVAFALLSRPALPTDDISPPLTDVPVTLEEGRTLGSAAAPVKVDIWSDFQCPGCRQLATRVEPPLIGQFVASGTAQFVYHDAAFQGARVGGSYDESVESAAAARCAADQGKFWVMHDWIFANWNGENEGAFRAERLRRIAEAAGLDMAAYDTCMAAGDKQAAVRAETQQGLAAGVNQTPTVFINGTMYTGRMTGPDLSAAIVAAAGNASPAPMGVTTAP